METWVPVLVALIAAVGSVVAARNSVQINRAVNHKPKDDPTLYQHAKNVSQLLTDFVEYQHGRNHDLANQITVASGRTALLDQKVEGYVTADAAAHEAMIDRMERLERKIGARK